MRFPLRRQPVRHTAHFERVLGTSLELQLSARDRAASLAAEKGALDEIERLDGVFSSYRADSELARWQRTLGVEAPVSPELGEVLEASEAWRVRSGGAFNPAVEALTRLWRAAAESGAEPAEAELAALAAQMDAPLWRVDRARGTAVRLLDLPVTLNAVAKGYIIDRSCDAAMEAGATMCLVNLGGDLRHRGEGQAAAEVADPAAPHENATPLCTVRLSNQGMATSGGYRRGFQVGETWRSHVLDPRTGHPAESLASVSIVAESAMLADMLATVCGVLHMEESLPLVEQAGGAALLVFPDDRSVSTPAWRASIVQ